MTWFEKELLTIPPMFTCQTDELKLVLTTVGGSTKRILELQLYNCREDDPDSSYCYINLDKGEAMELIEALWKGMKELK